MMYLCKCELTYHRNKNNQMKKQIITLTLLLLFTSLNQTISARQKPTDRIRVLVSTDIGGTDPDDNQSMTHLLMSTLKDSFHLLRLEVVVQKRFTA